ncbi:MAG: hypothetical protein K9G76_11170 [Bacteroidales bacterium]|nr:hypothetical protein [Bacteroidales bacterium]MCF8404954.1 hypothetical protein [Bacteroidales bacterium]
MIIDCSMLLFRESKPTEVSDTITISGFAWRESKREPLKVKRQMRDIILNLTITLVKLYNGLFYCT